MGRFLILFNAPEPMSVFMAQATAEERQTGLNAWGAWKAEADKSIKFEFGGVVEAVCRVEPGAVNDSPNHVSNYGFAEADSREAVEEALRDHPHLQRAGASIDVLQVLSMPGQ